MLQFSVKRILTILLSLCALAQLSQAAETSSETKAATKAAGKTAKVAKKAKAKGEAPIRAGASIVVEKYDADHDELIVKIIKEPAVGPNIAKPADLVEAIGIPDEGLRKKLITKPTNFIGTVYVLQKDLKLQVPDPNRTY